MPAKYKAQSAQCQHPQVIPSGQNIHVRFVYLYHTMIHVEKNPLFLGLFTNRDKKTLKGISQIKVHFVTSFSLLLSFPLLFY